MGFPGGSDGKIPAYNVGDLGSKIPWRTEWLPIPVFLPGESHGQRSLAGYSPWDSKESDMTERLTYEYTEIEINFENKEVQTLLSVFVKSFMKLHL